MAKLYTKKRAGGKTTGRYVKKKPSKRVSKRGPLKNASSRFISTIVAGEVAKALNSGAQLERRKVTMALEMQQRQVFINGKMALMNCIRIPITEAIPAMAGSSCQPDVRRRTSNKVTVTGVNVRASFSVSDETRVMVFPYEPHDSERRHLAGVPVVMRPDAKQGKVPEFFATEMAHYSQVGLVSKHGPLMVKKSGDDSVLDSVDGTPYESRVSTHTGKPIGTVYRKVFGKGGLRRTLNWDQGGNHKGVGAGYTQWTTEMVNEYWPLNKQYTYMYEVMNDQLFERNAEMVLYVDCPSVNSTHIPEDIPLVGAVVRNVIVDIYFR